MTKTLLQPNHLLLNLYTVMNPHCEGALDRLEVEGKMVSEESVRFLNRFLHTKKKQFESSTSHFSFFNIILNYVMAENVDVNEFLVLEEEKLQNRLLAKNFDDLVAENLSEVETYLKETVAPMLDRLSNELEYDKKHQLKNKIECVQKNLRWQLNQLQTMSHVSRLYIPE